MHRFALLARQARLVSAAGEVDYVGYVVDLSIRCCACIDLRKSQGEGLNAGSACLLVPVCFLQLALEVCKHCLHQSMRATRAWIDANDACIPPRRAAESTHAQQTGPACMSMRRSKMQGLGMRMRAGISIFRFVAPARCRWCSQFPAHSKCQRTAKATTCGGRKPPFPPGRLTLPYLTDALPTLIT